jgi:hypothetical protein
MWVPDADGNLVAEKGDNEETLKTYLSTIYDGTDKISDDEWNSFSSQINSAANASETGDITGTKLNSTNGTFDNLVGKYLYTQSQKNSSWAVTRFPGNNCSPTTFNRVDKAMEFVYGKDILGKLSWNNSIYKNWQGAGAGLFGTGVISSMGYGSLVSEQDILGGSLQTGALLRMTQVPGPGGTSVSWHAVIFLNYTYDNSGNINGMTYWQQVDELINTINFNSNNGGTYNFSNGYKPKLGTNFK